MSLEWVIVPIELSEAAFKVHKALRSLAPFYRHGILSLLRNRVELDHVYELLKNPDSQLLVARPFLDMENEFDESLRRSAKSVAADICSRYRNFLQLMNMMRLRTWLLGRICATPALTVSIASDLSRIEYTTTQGSRIVIDNPRLLWECSCNVPREYVRKGIACRVHEQDINNAIANAFGGGLVELRYDDISLYWKDIRTLWPPSIDSLHFADVLRRCIPQDN